MAFLLMGYCGFTVATILAWIFGRIRFQNNQSLNFGILLRQVLILILLAVSMTGFYLSGTHLLIGSILWTFFLILYGASIFLSSFTSYGVKFSFNRDSVLAVIAMQIVDAVILGCVVVGFIVTKMTNWYGALIALSVVQFFCMFGGGTNGGRVTYIVRFLICTLATLFVAFVHYDVLSFAGIYSAFGDISAYDFGAFGVPLTEWTFVVAICMVISLVMLMLESLLNQSLLTTLFAMAQDGVGTMILRVIYFILSLAEIVFIGYCFILSGRLLAGAIVQSVVFILKYIEMAVVCARKDDVKFLVEVSGGRVRDLPRLFHLLPVVASFVMMFLCYFFHDSNFTLAIFSSVCGGITLIAFIWYMVKGRSVTTKLCLAIPLLLCIASAVLAFLTFYGVIAFDIPVS